jgi:hypothetical protein
MKTRSLADPVTRDEAGNVVPLSRRFDITSPKVFEQRSHRAHGCTQLDAGQPCVCRKANMGGLAVPSIGVITEKAGWC